MADTLVTLFLCGDVMTGRGIDQVLPSPCAPTLHESAVKDARAYVDLAQKQSGPIPAPVPLEYPWGDALAELAHVQPDARIVNLETSITRSDDHWPDKQVNYRMSPENAECLAIAKIDVCCLANNHVLDWGAAGLLDTLASLDRLGVAHAGAGRTAREAQSPAVIELGEGGRVLVFAFGSITAGVPVAWSATDHRPGVNLLPDLPLADTVQRIRALVEQWRGARDLVVLSIHWGANWEYHISPEARRFAHRLIDEAGIDVIHGHSSHHVKGIEVYHDRPIIYGCGDLLTDYEGIQGYEAYRGGLGLMYFPTLDLATGRLQRFRMTPTQMHRFQVKHASDAQARWLEGVLRREGRQLGTFADLDEDGQLVLCWT
jgi:poly-gamma-glutamate capsule biosynthesis protein CapA/YwtB (metallophosphatase superfamily)